MTWEFIAWPTDGAYSLLRWMVDLSLRVLCWDLVSCCLLSKYWYSKKPSHSSNPKMVATDTRRPSRWCWTTQLQKGQQVHRNYYPSTSRLNRRQTRLVTSCVNGCIFQCVCKIVGLRWDRFLCSWFWGDNRTGTRSRCGRRGWRPQELSILCYDATTHNLVFKGDVEVVLWT